LKARALALAFLFWHISFFRFNVLTPECFNIRAPIVKSKPFKLVPGLIALAVILLVCLLRLLRLEFFERLECISYDIRARQALIFSPRVATNLGFVYINEDSLRAVWNGSLGFRFGISWPRQVYGRVVDELSEQEAKVVAFDVLFGELRPDHPPVQLGTNFPDSDDFFAAQMRKASNVIIALTEKVTPPSLFLTNAIAVGDITTEKDPDGILRRVEVFRFYTNWHNAFQQVEADPDYGVNLTNVIIEPRQITLRRKRELGDIKIALDQDGKFELADFAAGRTGKARPFTVQRAWHMGVILAARELNLDLDKAEIDLPNHSITLRNPAGLERILPVDAEGYFYVDWCLPPNHPALTKEPIQELLLQDMMRLKDQTNGLVNRWRGKLAVIGSAAQIGNNLTDRGATPLSNDTLLVSKHWNVANSIITGRFVRRSPLIVDLALIILLGIIAALLTWELRILTGGLLVVLVALAYIFVAAALYIQTRFWVPIVLPIGGAMLITYICTIAWRVIFEQEARRRIIESFGTVVSKKILDVILASDKLSLGGTRREITVLFSDVRGFTEFSDTSQERVENYIKQNNLAGAAAEAYIDEQARETLDTVNKYLGLVADTIMQHDAVLDKFMGDCVMAFWGAPTPYPRHAVACVRAAIAAQRAIYDFNERRALENKSREVENQARLSAGLPPKQMLPLLLLGSGINTGMATAGWMGSASGTKNYTVFGREVNLASRLEGLSGRGRIFISEATYKHLLRDDSTLAATCILQPPQKAKGFAAAINVYEVPWRLPTDATVPSDTTSTSISLASKTS
jgi:class 3 adenylate cyclase/CHASE2 domain-containing sensor protein